MGAPRCGELVSRARPLEEPYSLSPSRTNTPAQAAEGGPRSPHAGARRERVAVHLRPVRELPLLRCVSSPGTLHFAPLGVRPTGGKRAKPKALTSAPPPPPPALADGSHKAFNAKHNTTLAPRPYKNEAAEEVTAYLCACGKTKNPTGHCDGSHKQ